MRLFSALALALSTLLILSSATALPPRQVTFPDGGAKLFIVPACVDTGGLGLGVVTKNDIVANTCYEASADSGLIGGVFSSALGYPAETLPPGYTCSFQAFWKAGCEGLNVGNQEANDGYNTCINTLNTPESLSLDIFARSYKWACCENES